METQIYKSSNLLALFILLIITGLLNACSSGSSSSPGSTSNGVDLGTLPNGSTVYASSASFTVTAGGSPNSTGTIGITGGEPNSTYTLTFGNSVLTSTSIGQKLSSTAPTMDFGADDNGITVRTTPLPCTIGTTGTGLPTSCTINITVSASTPTGTYSVTPSATSVDNNTNTAGAHPTGITTLGPIMIVVGPAAPSSAKAITFFSLIPTGQQTGTVQGIINGLNISVIMPYGTNTAALTSTFTTTGESVSVNTVIIASGDNSLDYDNPVNYTVTAQDGSSDVYIVTVTVAPNPAKTITAYSINGVQGTISQANNTISVLLPNGTSIDNLAATFTYTGSSITVNTVPQLSGVTTNNFTSPVNYLVTAADTTSVTYVVTVTTAAPAGGTYAYVTNYGDNTISMYSFESTSGRLTPLTPATISGTGISGPYGIAFSNTGNYAYVTNINFNPPTLENPNPSPGIFPGTVSMYSESSNGQLAPLNPATIAAGLQPSNIVVSPSGNYVYVPNPDAEDDGFYTVNQYSLNQSTGLLAGLNPESIVTADSTPYAITLTPSGKYAYVTTSHQYTAGINTATVSMFSVESSTGTLSPLSPATIQLVGSASAFSNATAITIDPSGQFVYVAGENANGGVVWYLKVGTGGQLTPLSPGTIAAGNAPQAITFDPSGSFVYVANYDDNTISMYSFAATGILTPLNPATAATGTSPHGISFDPSGRFAYVTNFNPNTSLAFQNPGSLTMYNFNSQTGVLTPMSPESSIATGNEPASIVFN